MLGLMYEKRPLKRPRLGPPDVYPQEAKQREDDMSLNNVKHGFPTTPQLTDEFGTARNYNVSASKVGAYFTGILTRKEELSILPDCGRKKQQINPKDNFWPATARTKGAIEAWFKDLAGSKPLMSLAKKAPNFNKKEEIFMTLTEHQVPMARATWFVKLSSAYTVAVSEAKIKKRQLPDPTTEWTQTLIKFLKDQIPKLAEHYQNPSNSGNTTPGQANSTPGSSTPNSNTPSNANTPGSNQGTPNSNAANNSNIVHHPMHSPALGSATPTGAGNSGCDNTNNQPTVDSAQALKQWSYCVQLARWLIEEGLIDRHDFLTWVIELLDKRTPDDGLLRLFLPLTLQYMSEFGQCELLSRRLAHSCCKKLGLMCQQLNESSIQQLNAADLLEKCKPQPNSQTPTAEINVKPEPTMQEQVSNAIGMSPLDSEMNGNMDMKPPRTASLNPNSVSNANGCNGNGIDIGMKHIKKEPQTEQDNGQQQQQSQQQSDQQDSKSNTSNNKHTSSSSTNQQNCSSSVTCPIRQAFAELLSCPHHLDIVLQLSTIVQIICMECSTALVWSGVADSRSALHGSPLDLLPIPPSALPMPFMDTPLTDKYRRQVYEAEREIMGRSRRAENKWCADKWQNSSQGTNTTRVLAVLEALDRHSFDRVEANNNLDTLYNKVFGNIGTTNNSNNSATGGTSGGHHINSGSSNGNNQNGKEANSETRDPEWACPYSVVLVLCEWAVCNARWGEHRAIAAAALLDRRQQQLLASQTGNNDKSQDHHGANDDKESICSGAGIYGGPPIFQGLLMRFLDNDAPVLEDGANSLSQNKAQFTNLVHLFGELIRRDVFSHDAYMCTLISRGDLLGATEPMSLAPVVGGSTTPMGGTLDQVGHHHHTPSLDDEIFGIGLKPKIEDHVKMDYDDAKIDDDLDQLLQHIKQDQQNSMDAPDSPKEPGDTSHSVDSGMIGVLPPPSRHLVYTSHFPLPWQESEGGAPLHDTNQRHVLLYGVGRHRDEARHQVKKMAKEICKLFSKKFSIDVAEGGKVKKHSGSEFNFEAVTQKFQSMNYFDQHVVTWTCGTTVVEMLQSFASGTSSYLPVQEHVAFLFDLMELAVNVYGLIDVSIQILKELLEVESVLASRSPGQNLLRSYTTSLALYVVGVLRRYHCCLLLSTEQYTAVFEQLCKLVKPVINPSDCSSAERCILAYLYDLYSVCPHLRSKTHQAEPFSNAYPKIRQVFFVGHQPTPSSNYVYNPMVLNDAFITPRRGGKIDPCWARQIQESPNNRYSFVCSAILAICRETDNDRVNDIAIMCCEMTACCGGLSSEWLGALMALCNSSSGHQGSYYPDLLVQIDVHNLSIHNSLAVFTGILIARHCFSLENFVCTVALPSLLKGCNSESRSEAGARLTCHLLLKLFKTIETPQPGLYSVSTSPHPTPGCPPSIRLSCDRHLLAAAHKNIAVGPLVATLKAIQVVGDATAKDNKSTTGSVKKSSSGGTELSHILGTSDAATSDANLDLMSMIDLDSSNGHKTPRQNQSSLNSLDSSMSLSEFARHVLAEICGEEWVMQKCLQNPEELCQQDMLLDSMLTPKQAQRLLHMICYPDSASNNQQDVDQKTIITRILENLEQWSLRMSWLDLQLMFKQFIPGSQELNQWLETVARAAIDVFHLPTTPQGSSSNGSSNGSTPENKDINSVEKRHRQSIWLVAPLVSRLPPPVQGRVLRVAGQLLEGARQDKSPPTPHYKGGQNLSNSGARKLVGAAAPALCHQPFLALVLTCLRGQDDQKEGLLTSLHTQLSQFLQTAKEERQGSIEDYPLREQVIDGLQLRFSLLGGMFDIIQRNATVTSDWAILLVQLISYGVIDFNNNSYLLTTVIDMLATLVHWTLANDNNSGGSTGDENKKQYQNLMKKLRKEVGERHGPEMTIVRQLLPLPKITFEVIACEPVGCLTDTKGNKISGFDSIDKKQGLRLSEKQRVSPWEVVEIGRSPAPLSWAWFGATKMDRKPLTYEHTHKLLRYHTHSLVKPSNYYLEPLPLPPEDLDAPAEKPGLDRDGSLDSPTGLSRRGMRGRKPRKNKTITPVQGQPNTSGQMYPGQMCIQPGQQPQQMQQQQPQQQQQMGPANPMMGPMQGQTNMGPMGPSTMGPQPDSFPQQHQQQQWFQQQNYYGQQGDAMVRAPMVNQSKQALSNMLRQRQPLGGAGPGFAPQPQQTQHRPGLYARQPRPHHMGQGSQMGQMGGQMGQMSNQMGQMGGQMGQMGGQMGSIGGMGQMGGPGQMVPGQMGPSQMGQNVNQMSQMSGMGGGQGSQSMFGGQQYGMGPAYSGGGYGGQPMMQGQQGSAMGMNQMINQMGQAGNQIGQGVNQMGQSMGQLSQSMGQMGQGVNQMGQGVGQMSQSVAQMNQGIGQMAQMNQGVGQMGQGVGQMGQGVGQMGQGVGQMGQGVNQGAGQMGQSVGQMNQGMGQMGGNVNQMGQGVGQMGQNVGQMGQGVGQMGGMMPMTSQSGGMGAQGQPGGMGGFPGQQFQGGMMGGRSAQEAAAFMQQQQQQRQNVRPQYMGGPAPPYTRPGMPNQQNQQFQQQVNQQQMRQRMMLQQGNMMSRQYPPPY